MDQYATTVLGHSSVGHHGSEGQKYLWIRYNCLASSDNPVRPGPLVCSILVDGPAEAVASVGRSINGGQDGFWCRWDVSVIKIFARLHLGQKFLAEVQLAEDIVRIKPGAKVDLDGLLSFELAKLHVLEQQRDPIFFRKKRASGKK